MLNFPPKRLICLSEETVETIYLLEQEHKLVGVTGYAVRPSRVRKEKPRVSSFVSGNIEKIRALNPDLILTFSDVQAQLSKELISEGFNVLAFNQRNIAEIYAMVKTLGALLNCKLRASLLVQKLKRIIAKYDSIDRSHKPRVYFEEWNEPLITGISWVSELVEIAGGTDIFVDKSKVIKAEGRVVSSDEVIAANPDIILASWCGKKVNVDLIAHRPGWKQISAIKANLIYEIKSPMVLQPGPGAIIDGLPTIYKIISNWDASRKR